jgi:hypothetical protein
VKSSACPYAPSLVPSSLMKFEMLRSVTAALKRFVCPTIPYP